MSETKGRPLPYPLTSQPSTSFSSVSSAASATSAATSRSGCSKLLFGEIDTTSERSNESYASVCSFVLCDSGKFLTFWLNDACREAFISHLPKSDLASLRLACHDFSVRAAPALFNDLNITFRTSTFTRPARLAALDRLGYYVKTLRFELPHSEQTFLPPLVDPESGEELSFTYTPNLRPSSPSQPKYGDLGTTEILTRQYPPLFHASTNVPAFIAAFSSFINLEHLSIGCPGYDDTSRYRRSIIDYALISIRIAVERNCLNALTKLTLSPIHPGALHYLNPACGYGASPRSASRWRHITHLTIHSHSLSAAPNSGEPDHYRLLQAYLANFNNNLQAFNFRWLHDRGPMPIKQTIKPRASQSTVSPNTPPKHLKSKVLHFPKLRGLNFENVQLPAREFRDFVDKHKQTLRELDMVDADLTNGTWDEALQPIVDHTRRKNCCPDTADIPIMLSPTVTAPSAFPRAMERVKTPVQKLSVRSSLRPSNWLPALTYQKPAGVHRTEKTLRRTLLTAGLWK